MSGPIETAAATLAARLAETLAGVGLLEEASRLEVNPASAIDSDGTPDVILRAAALFTVQTVPVRTLMGSGAPRYIVERQFRLEVAVAGPDAAWRDQMLAEGLGGVARLVAGDPTLGGACERVELTGRDDDDLPPNGVKVLLSLVLRVSAGDPLGLTN